MVSDVAGVMIPTEVSAFRPCLPILPLVGLPGIGRYSWDTGMAVTAFRRLMKRAGSNLSLLKARASHPWLSDSPRM